MQRKQPGVWRVSADIPGSKNGRNGCGRLGLFDSCRTGRKWTAVAVLQNFGLFALPGFPELRGYREFLHRGGFPKLTEHQFAWCDLPSYSRCLKFKGTGAGNGAGGRQKAKLAQLFGGLIRASGAVNGGFKAVLRIESSEGRDFGNGDIEFRPVAVALETG